MVFPGLLLAQCPTSVGEFSSGSYTITTECPPISATSNIISRADIDIQSTGSLTIDFSGGGTLFDHLDGLLTVSGDFIIKDGDLAVANLSSDPNMAITSTGLVSIPDGAFTLGFENTVTLDLEGELRMSGTFTANTGAVVLGDGCYEASSLINSGDFTGFTGGTCASLPVELVSFTAQNKKGRIALAWATATEINNEGFEIERSTDGLQFETIAFVPGHGTTTAYHQYTYQDAQYPIGPVFYRLKQLDYDGAYEYSRIIAVQAGIGDIPVKIYPTVVNSEVHFDGLGNVKYGMTITDISGRRYLQTRASRSLDQLEVLLTDRLSSMPSSVYIVTLSHPTGNQILKFVKQ